MTISREAIRRVTIWGLPAIATVLLVLVGWWSLSTVERSVRQKLSEELETILRADIAALTTWLNGHKATARVTATRSDVINATRELVSIERDGATALGDVRRLELLTELNLLLQPTFESHGYEGFAVIDGGGKIVCAYDPQFIGLRVHSDHLATLGRAMEGETVITRPFLWQTTPSNETTKPPVRLPTMFVATPVRGDRGRPMAVLALRIPPDKGFTAIVQVARSGETGETYAFDADGIMLSNSRFDSELREIGLLSKETSVHALLNISIRDPGANLVAGEQPTKPRDEQPLTEMAARAIAAGKRGDQEIFVDVHGYNDYRGVPVVGAWTWLPEYGFGVATEADVAEAFAPLITLRTVFGGLFALVVVGTVAVLGFVQAVSVMRRRIQRAERRVEKLGQYALEEKIGEGGMGEVYRASHAMLRRPTAIKLLRPERSSERAISRFEREVQLTSQLTNANTIVIFDYGRTPENVFYYAMEYLDGVDLSEVVEYGGTQPEGRVIHVLRQICGSLAEAHHIGLIHRDIKPANIMLCERGGQADLVKVLDFGLVKDVGGREEVELSMPGAITGTPLYIAPESVTGSTNADARSDLYAVGAVGYFLLTGKHVFDGKSATAIMNAHVNMPPVAPSERLGRTVARDLEDLLMRCLAKNPDDRPQSSDELADALEACQNSGDWTRADARRWWEIFRASGGRRSSRSPSPATSTTEPDETILLNPESR